MTWIQTIEPAAADGPLKAEYDEAVRRAGKVYNIIKLQSLNPGALRGFIQLYLATMRQPSKLTRADREILATVVSQINGCFY